MYNRVETKSQTKSDALLQVASGEIWGRDGRQGRMAAVRAYAGGLKPGARGIEFSTTIAPHGGGNPIEAHWYLGFTPGVLARVKNGEDYACITAVVTNLQL
jgi:hypothetical protein